MKRAAELVLGFLSKAGIDGKIVETGGHPAIIADTGRGAGKAKALVYGHYDVQPEGDLNLWKSPPFEPTLRDGAVFARGSSDDKGQVLCHIFAAEAWMKTHGSLPVRVKYLIEGEEEIGSPTLGDVVRKEKERLSCDYVAISDTSKFSIDTPAITTGTRGLVYMEVFIDGPKQNLHSGTFGGSVANPGNVLAKIIASMKDDRNRVTITGFYDDVEEPSAAERKAMAALPFDEKAYLAELGSPGPEGEEGWTSNERRWVRPTLDVNGIIGGYTGEGASTVIPARMSAKISMRLVPHQSSARIAAAFREHVERVCPKTVRLAIKQHGAADAYGAPLDSPGIAAAGRAVEKGFGKKPVFMREGGSLPILPMFRQLLGADSLLMGFADPNCNLHGPNEFFRVADFEAGIRSAAHFLAEIGSA
jgi:acetylornithine deacetylase/succinyl-diaminopimelate desuccinylase-like protein